MNILYLIAFILSLSGWGIAIYLRFFSDDRPKLERFLILQAIGFTMTWLFIFLFASFGILHPMFVHLWVLMGCVIYLIKWRIGTLKGGWWDELLKNYMDAKEGFHAILLVSISVFAYALFLYFTFAPTTTWDPLDYHYVLPREWLLNEGFVNLPGIMYSNFPASVELIWLVGMALSNDILSNHFTWWFGVLMGLSIIHIGRTWFRPIAGWIGLVLILALPIVYTEEMPGGVIDLAVFTFNLLTVHFAIKYVKSWKIEDAVLMVLYSSNALAMKHSSILTLIFAVLLVLYFSHKKNAINSGLKISALIFAASFILPLPWYIKSFIYTGNPVYPFLNTVFNPGSNLSIDILYWSNPNFTRGILDWLTYWYSVTTDIGMVQFRFRLINGIYLGMLPLLYFALKKRGYHRAFIAYSLFMIVLLLYNAPGEPRYQLAAWAVLGIAYGFGLYESGIMRDSTMRYIFPLAIIFPLTVSMVMCVHENRNKHDFILKNQNRRDYYMRNIGVYPLIDHVNKSTVADSKVIWCDPRIYLFERDYIPAYPFDTGILPSWREDAIEIVKEWRSMGVTNLGFTMGANYRAWVVGVLLLQAEMDGVNNGFMYVEDNFSPGYKYEAGSKLDFSYDPMKREVQRLGPLTPRSLQLASYATDGIDFVRKNNLTYYSANLEKLIDQRNDDIDVVMIRKLIEIGNLGFLSPVKTVETEGILFEINYKPLIWLDRGIGGEN